MNFPADVANISLLANILLLFDIELMYLFVFAVVFLSQRHVNKLFSPQRPLYGYVM